MSQETTSINKQSLFTWKKEYAQYLMPGFITLILLVGHLSFGILDSYLNLVVSIGTAVVIDLVAGWLFFRSRKNLTSAYISGISAGILIRSVHIWPYVLTPAISILSKYVLRYKGKHLWNPTNFGVSWMLFLGSSQVGGLSTHWGNNLMAMSVIWILGFIIVNRVGRLHISLTYVASFVLLAIIRSFITGDAILAELSPLTGPMYQLFIFFMITDPPTTVSGKKGQILVAFLVAVVEFILRLNDFIYAPFYALFIVGPIAKFIDLRRTKPEEVPAVKR